MKMNWNKDLDLDCHLPREKNYKNNCKIQCNRWPKTRENVILQQNIVYQQNFDSMTTQSTDTMKQKWFETNQLCYERIFSKIQNTSPFSSPKRDSSWIQIKSKCFKCERKKERERDTIPRDRYGPESNLNANELRAMKTNHKSNTTKIESFSEFKQSMNEEANEDVPIAASNWIEILKSNSYLNSHLNFCNNCS